MLSIYRNQTGKVLNELRETINKLAKTSRPIYAHFPVEVRFVASSDIYLAPTQGRTSAYINIICYRPYRQIVEHESYWRLYEGILKPVGGRPHWAKSHRETANDFVKMYPLFRKWIQVRNRADPTKMFYNTYMERIFESNDSIPLDLPMNFFAPNNTENATSTPIKMQRSLKIGNNNVENDKLGGDIRVEGENNDLGEDKAAEKALSPSPIQTSPEPETVTDISSLSDPETESDTKE